ncbi:MAG: bifunctional proline dehydrogenase/L-glutamate gamma-semialdehyde dehydrogenase, partial [Proteobacteria bacterium SW_6_67_9]
KQKGTDSGNYQRNARRAIEEWVDWLADLGRRTHRRLMVRLVKGAYWDTEIKLAQEKGLDDYPVFTRKANTDVSYLACARRLLAHRDVIYPQFATHNAHTVAAVYALAGDREGYELQRLHGMGEALYEHVLGEDKLDIPVRIYAPVGSHEDLLPYLVRRLLENGANSSFVNRLIDDRTPIDAIIADPVEQVRQRPSKRHPKIPLPRYILGEQRLNSWGVDLSDIVELQRLDASMSAAAAEQWHCAPIISGRSERGEPLAVVDPSHTERTIGTVIHANREQCGRAMTRAARAQPEWDARPAHERAALLEAMAEQLEHNELQLHGRGVFVCISPWNFPLAIFTGQVAAALVAGNSVIAKPA